jgi:hypothetical protein
MRVMLRNRILRACVVLVATLMVIPQSNAYSVLSHEQVVDLAWKDTIVPMLMARFPETTAEQLKEAHSYAYGGSVIQDIGYYPYGTHYFSDLLHYVNTGDYVVNLLRDSENVDEYAFALGALAHYAGDIVGHPVAVNVVTAQENPKLAEKYGRSVTYDEDPTAHVRTEFSFDVVEVAKGRYQEQDYRNFIGFNVSKDLMNRAFSDTYGLQVEQVMKSEDKAINSYRHDVSDLIPRATKVAWAAYGKDIVAEQHDATERTYVYRMSRTSYEKDWGVGYQKPSAGEEFLAFIVHLLPKVGPLKAVKVKMPSSVQQDLYLKSMNQTVTFYQSLLKQVAAAAPTQFANLKLDEMDFDTGKPTAPGEYALADATFGKLVVQLTAPNAPPIPEPLRANLVAFYANPVALSYLNVDPEKNAKKDEKERKEVEIAVTRLQQTAVAPAVPAQAAAGSSGSTTE